MIKTSLSNRQGWGAADFSIAQKSVVCNKFVKIRPIFLQYVFKTKDRPGHDAGAVFSRF